MHEEVALEYIIRKRTNNYNDWIMNDNLLDIILIFNEIICKKEVEAMDEIRWKYDFFAFSCGELA